MITERIYIRSPGLGEIHEQLARMEEAGWSKASPLMYTHDEAGQGWEIALYREIDELGDCHYSFGEFLNRTVICVLVLVAAAAASYATVSAVRWIW